MRMRRRLLPGTDLEVSALCYGTGGFGTQCRGDDLDRRIDAFRAAGGNFLDTAHCYAVWLPGGDGASERAIGDYVRRRGKGDLVIATKGGHPTMPGYRVTDAWLSPGRVAADIDDSLGRLGIETIDLYWLHRDDTRVPVADIVETLNAEVRRGRIRHLGASNWRASRIAEANAYAAAHGLRGFCASQPEWNLAHKNVSDAQRHDTTGTAMLFLPAEDEAWHRRTGFPLIPYTSNAGGYFASAGSRASAAYDNPVSQARLARCRQLTEQLEATPGQIALAWLLAQEFPVFPIIGTLDLEHLRETLAAASLHLTPSQAAWLPQPG